MSLGAITLDLTELVRQVDLVRRVLADQLTEVQNEQEEARRKADQILASLARIEVVVGKLVVKGEAMANELKAEIDRVAALVTRNTEVDTSAIALIEQIVQMLRDAAEDPARVRALADQLEADNSRLAAAVAANTPSAPTP